MYIVAFFIGFLFWKSCKFWRRLRALDYIWKSGVGFTLFYFTNLFVEILGRKGSGTMIFIVSWCYGGLAMVILFYFGRAPTPPGGTTRGCKNKNISLFSLPILGAALCFAKYPLPEAELMDTVSWMPWGFQGWRCWVGVFFHGTSGPSRYAAGEWRWNVGPFLLASFWTIQRSIFWCHEGGSKNFGMFSFRSVQSMADVVLLRISVGSFPSLQLGQVSGLAFSRTTWKYAKIKNENLL